jgi:hypothetical protein
MARCTFAVQADGLIVDVLVTLERLALDGLRARGQPVPAPIPCRGLIDTGTNITAIGPSLRARLGLSPGLVASTITAAGPLNVALHVVGLSITNLMTPGAPELSLETFAVMELPTALAAADVLVGLDVLLRCCLGLNGPGRMFELDF